MKAWLLKRTGNLKHLVIGEAPKPRPKQNQVRIKVEAVGLNPVDYKLAEHGHKDWKLPHILGLDVAGQVEAVPKGISNWQIGDRVYFHGNLATEGGFAQYCLIDSSVLARIPQKLSYIEAAAIPCAGFTAYQALINRLAIKPGRFILITGGAGGVGTFAVQIALNYGMKVITTCSEKNVEFLESLGVEHLINYREEDICKQVMKITGAIGADFILDTVSSTSATEALNCLAYGGQIACIAGMPDISGLEPWTKALTLHEINLGGAYLSKKEDERRQLAEIGTALGTMVANGTVNPVITEVIGFEQIPDGLKKIKAGHVRGKIVAAIGTEGKRVWQSDSQWAPKKSDKTLTRIPTTKQPDQYWNSFLWEDLNESEQALWKTLGWSAKSWRGETSPPKTFNTGWKHLSEKQRKAATKLGYKKNTWNTA